MTYDEKKQCLLDYRLREMRVRDIEAEITAIKSRAVNTVQGFNDVPSRSAIISKTERAIELLEEAAARLEKERLELERLNLMIITAIGKLDNIAARQILTLKYIGEPTGKYHNPLKLWQIANRLGYSTDHIKHLHIKAISDLDLS